MTCNYLRLSYADKGRGGNAMLKKMLIQVLDKREDACISTNTFITVFLVSSFAESFFFTLITNGWAKIVL